MAEEGRKPGLRFPSLEGDPASPGDPPDEGSDPVQTLKGLWYLIRLALTISALGAGGFMTSCGTFIAASQLAQTPLGPGSRSSPAVVVAHKRSGYGTRHSQYVYAPVVRFTVDGRAFEVTSRLATNTPVPVGEAVTVRYDASAPEHAVLVGWAEWGMPVEWMAIGGPLLAAGIFGWRRRWWERPDSWW